MSKMQRERGNFGDSVGNTPKCDVKEKKSNHVFDGAGENVQYLSDSESLGSRNTKTRYINPAIYIETVESTHSVTSLHTDSSCIDDVTPHPHSSYRSRSTPLLSCDSSSTGILRKSCRLDTGVIFDDEDDQTPRNDRTYRENGADTFRLSVASASTNTTAKEERARNDRKKQEAFRQWLTRKDEERREKARLEKLKLPELSAATEKEREECFRRWLWRKQAENAYRKVEVIVGEYQDKRRQAESLKREKDNEQTFAEWTRRKEEEMKGRRHLQRLLRHLRVDKREKDNEQTFAEWTRRKEEEMKAIKSREEQRAARAAFEEARRRANGERAYRDWLRTSKYKPLPVPLNKGELSMRGSISEMYINPIPWQSPT